MVRVSYNAFNSSFVLAVFPISPGVFWPYFAGGVTAIVGLCLLKKNAVQGARGLDKLVPFERQRVRSKFGISIRHGLN